MSAFTPTLNRGDNMDKIVSRKIAPVLHKIALHKTVLLLLLFLVLIAAAVAEEPSGDGSEENPFYFESMEGGILGVTEDCIPLVRLGSGEGSWQPVHEQTAFTVEGEGTETNPFKIAGGVKGITCHYNSASIVDYAQLLYWDPAVSITGGWVMELSSIPFQGDGSEENPWHLDSGEIGILGMTNACELMAKPVDGEWEHYEFNKGKYGFVRGDGSENNPFRVDGGVTGVMCRHDAGANEFPLQLLRWDPAKIFIGSWVDVAPAPSQAENSPQGAIAQEFSRVTAPSAAPPLGTIIQETREFTQGLSRRSQEIDEVWQKIRDKIGVAGEALQNIWHNKRWKRFEEVYLPESFAPSAGAGPCFPVRQESFESNSANFGSPRSEGKRCHAGVDLYTTGNAEIVAVDDGEVLGVNEFTECSGVKALRIMVYHPSLGKTINYAELREGSFTLRAGDRVSRGQVLGKADVCTSGENTMLHLELYEGRVERPLRWDTPPGPVVNQNQCAEDPAYLATKPAALLDPRAFLNTLDFCEEAVRGEQYGIRFDDTTHVQKIMEAADLFNMDFCFPLVVVSHESGGKSDTIGSDANVPGCKIKSRRLLLMRDSEACKNEYGSEDNPQEALMRDCLNNEDTSYDRYERPKKNVNACLDDFLDTTTYKITKPTRQDFCSGNFDPTFTYGIGLGQITPSAGSSSIDIYGKTYTHCELFDPNANIVAMLGLLKEKRAGKGQTQAEIQEVYQRYVGSLTPGALRRVNDHLACVEQRQLVS